MSSSEVNFLLQVNDGYSLRNTLCIAKSETTNLTIIFRPNSESISYYNKSCAVHIIKLKPTQFPIYEYNFVDDQGEMLEKYELTVDAAELYNTTKSTSKNDVLRIYWLKSEENRICVQILKATNRGAGNASAAYVNIIKNTTETNTVEYVVDKEVINENINPNVSIAARNFGDTCSAIASLKCIAMEIIGSKKMVTFNGIGANNTIQTTSEYKSLVNSGSESLKQTSGNIDSYLSTLVMPTEVSSNVTFTMLPADQIVTVRIPASTTKALSKIHNVSGNKTNTLDFYFVRGKPIHIVTQISTYGSYTIVIRNLNKY